MKVKYNLKSNSLYLYLCGELDECSASNVRGALDKLIDDNISVDSVVFNLSDLSFMDSTGIGMLLGRYKKLKKANVATYVENPSATADRIMQISGLYEIMPKI